MWSAAGKGLGGQESNKAQLGKGQTPQHQAPRDVGEFHVGKILKITSLTLKNTSARTGLYRTKLAS